MTTKIQFLERWKRGIGGDLDELRAVRKATSQGRRRDRKGEARRRKVREEAAESVQTSPAARAEARALFAEMLPNSSH